MQAVKVVAIDLLEFALLLALVEAAFRLSGEPDVVVGESAMWQKFHPYVMYRTINQTYKHWLNQFTGTLLDVHVTTNSLGFRDDREFDPVKPYRKKNKERVVLFTGGSVAWGVGATSNEKTVASRLQHWLTSSQHEYQYTVINLAMGSYIAYQQMIALDYWGRSFDPEWVVTMDGFNDASVFCGQSQGAFNPMYTVAMRAYIDGYLMQSTNPVFFRSEFLNWLLDHSAAATKLTGQKPIPKFFEIDEGGESDVRKMVQDTRIGKATQQVAGRARDRRLTAALCNGRLDQAAPRNSASRESPVWLAP